MNNDKMQVTNSVQMNTELQNKFLTSAVNYAASSNEVMTNAQKSNVLSLFAELKTNMAKRGITSIASIDMQGSNYIEQVKKWSRLNLSPYDKLFTDIRAIKDKNGNLTGKYSVTIKPQYQTLEKIMILYCRLPIIRFKGDIICVGDKLQTEDDFSTGLTKITGHIKNEKIDRNKYENVIGAYKIAYLNYENNGKLTQLAVIIDKDRIERARKAATTKDIWNSDPIKMIKKTATWELYNSEQIRPFLQFPSDIANNASIIEQSEEMDWNKETKFANVSQANENIEKEIGTNELPTIDNIEDDENIDDDESQTTIEDFTDLANEFLNDKFDD